MARAEEDARHPGSLEALRALTHPVRLRICAALAGGASSAAALARLLDLEHASASYHLRVLREAGLVELHEQRRVNGGLERRYRIIEPPDEPLAGKQPTTTEDWMALVAALGASLQVRAAQVNEDPKWFIDVEVWVPHAEAVRTRRQLDRALHRLRQHAVAPGTEGASRVSASAVLFGMRTDSGDDG